MRRTLGVDCIVGGGCGGGGGGTNSVRVLYRRAGSVGN